MGREGLEIVAVEPNEAMINGFRKVVPGVSILQGTADSLPFQDNSIDAVFVGQVTTLAMLLLLYKITRDSLSLLRATVAINHSRIVLDYIFTI